MAPKRFYPTLLLTFLLAGTLDAIAAIMLNYRVDPQVIFRFIASGVFGSAAFNGTTTMVALGILFHYLIAYMCTAAGFIMYPRLIKVFRNKYFFGISYGVVIWAVMNFIVVPLSNTPKSKAPMTPYSIITGILALVVCIGLPIGIMAAKYYRIGYKQYVPQIA